MNDRILKLKKQLGAVILAHNYQLPEIQELADYLGDSLELAKISKNLEAKIIVFCGVRFMAETVKILSPGKKVLLPAPDAGCPLANMIEPGQLRELKSAHPDAWTISYVNTSAEIKAMSEACCTSSNAASVVRNVPVKKVIFVPDKNLGAWVQKNIPEKELIIWPGWCYVHELFRLQDLTTARRLHPDAEIIVHPECRPEVTSAADHVLSTSGMLKRARKSSSRKFIVGTEIGLIHRLKRENPDKAFYSLGNARICVNMKKTTPAEVLRSLETGETEITLPADVIEGARRALEEMIKFV
jgi:quinolinate synthase